jgi:hypothetical protein
LELFCELQHLQSTALNDKNPSPQVTEKMQVVILGFMAGQLLHSREIH